MGVVFIPIFYIYTMIYNSVDNIPAKLYYTIQATGAYNLLVVGGRYSEKEISDAWNQIEQENMDQPGNGGLEKILTISKKVESLSCGYEGASCALHVLKAYRDEELIEKMVEQGYKFTWKKGDDSEENEKRWLKDLKNIENEINGLKIRLDSAKAQLPKVDEDEDSKKGNETFESTLLSYSTFIGAGFIDTNKIVLSQFNAIINIGNEKIKNIKNGTK